MKLDEGAFKSIVAALHRSYVVSEIPTVGRQLFASKIAPFARAYAHGVRDRFNRTGRAVKCNWSALMRIEALA